VGFTQSGLKIRGGKNMSFMNGDWAATLKDVEKHHKQLYGKDSSPYKTEHGREEAFKRAVEKLLGLDILLYEPRKEYGRPRISCCLPGGADFVSYALARGLPEDLDEQQLDILNGLIMYGEFLDQSFRELLCFAKYANDQLTEEQKEKVHTLCKKYGYSGGKSVPYLRAVK
jgi:hypothetical protein